MPESLKLANLLLQQSPACHWIVKAERKPPRSGRPGYGEIVFERIWGDPAPLFGKTAAELRGADCLQALPPDMAPPWCGRFERAFDGETLMLRERRGKSVWYVSVHPLQMDDEFAWAAGAGREITPWGTAEQELRHTVLGALKSQEFERNMMARFLHD